MTHVTVTVQDDPCHAAIKFMAFVPGWTLMTAVFASGMRGVSGWHEEASDLPADGFENSEEVSTRHRLRLRGELLKEHQPYSSTSVVTYSACSCRA